MRLKLAAIAIVAAAPAFAGQPGTHVHTVNKTTPVEDVTHEVTVVRVHPLHEITEIEKVLHHQEVQRSTEHLGPAPAQGHEHTVTRYIDTYPVDHKTVVHERTGSPAIDHEITRIVNHNVHHHHTDHRTVHQQEAARTIVHYKREDVDP